jgi:hypothetical protein
MLTERFTLDEFAGQVVLTPLVQNVSTGHSMQSAAPSLVLELRSNPGSHAHAASDVRPGKVCVLEFGGQRWRLPPTQ